MIKCESNVLILTGKGQSFSLLLHCTFTTEYYKKGRLNEQKIRSWVQILGSYSPPLAPLTLHVTEAMM